MTVIVTPPVKTDVDVVDLHAQILALLPPGSVLGIPFGERTPKRNLIFWGSM